MPSHMHNKSGQYVCSRVKLAKANNMHMYMPQYTHSAEYHAGAECCISYGEHTSCAVFRRNLSAGCNLAHLFVRKGLAPCGLNVCHERVAKAVAKATTSSCEGPCTLCCCTAKCQTKVLSTAGCIFHYLGGISSCSTEHRAVPKQMCRMNIMQT